MPPALVLLPPALLAAAAVACCGLGWARVRWSPLFAALAAWLAAAAAGVIWTASGRTPMELGFAPLTPPGSPVGLRLDAVSTAFALLTLVPAGLLLAFQRRTAWQCALTLVAALAAAVAVEADSLLVAAAALATCVTVLRGLLQQEEEGASIRAVDRSLQPGWLLVLWAAVALEVAGGTSTYAATPVAAFGLPIFIGLAAGAVLTAGVLPAGSWASLVWRRRRLEAGSMAVALLVPLGMVLLVRAYGLGGGHWPAFWLNLLLAALGTATALGAAYRAQAAARVQDCLAEAVPMGTGLALLSLALGTAAGVDAAFVALAGSALLAGLVPLLPGSPRPAMLAGLGVAAGLPPALAFAGWLLSVQAVLGAGAAFPLLGLAGAVAWLLWVAAVARALRLRDAAPPRSGAGTWTGVIAALVLGVASALLEAVIALPATGQVIPLPPALTSGVQLPLSLPPGIQLPVAQPSGGWSPLLLGLPLMVLLAVLWVAGRRVWADSPAPPARERPPSPLLPSLDPGGMVAARWPELVRQLDDGRREVAVFFSRVQERWLLRAVTGVSRSRPWFWAGITLVLVLVVTR